MKNKTMQDVAAQSKAEMNQPRSRSKPNQSQELILREKKFQNADMEEMLIRHLDE